MNVFTILFITLIAWQPTWLSAHGYFPENDLHLESPLESLTMKETEFNELIAKAEEAYAPIIENLGYKLEIRGKWDSTIVNALAIRAGWSLFIEINGGLARRPEVSSDGFTMVICHELGHFLAGLPYRTGSETWASSEGQSDYFATLACARKLWKNDIETNKKSLKKLLSLKGGEDVKKRCDRVWPTEKERNLCYRTVVVAHSLGGLSAYIKKNPIRPELNTPDKNVVDKTLLLHPTPQCRLDTYVAGALCNKTWPDNTIPAKGFKDKSDYKAMAAARSFACFEGVEKDGFRPRCWFNPKQMKLPEGHTLIEELGASVERDEWIDFGAIFVKPYGKLKVSMKGSGDADLYVGLDKAPSLKNFDFRPLKFGSEEEVIISSNENIENVHIAVQGWRSLSEVSLKVTSEFAVPLCLSHNGGEGESFPCLDDRSCRLIDSKKGQSMENWCYFYLENRGNTAMSKELN